MNALSHPMSSSDCLLVPGTCLIGAVSNTIIESTFEDEHALVHTLSKVVGQPDKD